MFYLIMQQNQCTHLELFAVAAGEALGRGVAELHTVVWRTGEVSLAAELAEFAGASVGCRQVEVVS